MKQKLEINNISKLRGWAQKSLKSFTDALGLRTKRNTLIAGYNYGTKELIAPMEYDGYTNTEVFLSWVEHFLCKELYSGRLCQYQYSSNLRYKTTNFG